MIKRYVSVIRGYIYIARNGKLRYYKATPKRKERLDRLNRLEPGQYYKFIHHEN